MPLHCARRLCGQVLTSAAHHELLQVKSHIRSLIITTGAISARRLCRAAKDTGLVVVNARCRALCGQGLGYSALLGSCISQLCTLRMGHEPIGFSIRAGTEWLCEKAELGLAIIFLMPWCFHDT